MKSIKIGFKYLFTFPQVIFHKVIGVNETYSDLVTFFRYFPFSYIAKDRNVHFFYKCKKIKIFYGDNKPVSTAVFKNGDYKDFDVKNKVVVDLGSAHGDTPILFILNGAKKVIGFELDKKRYDMSTQNIIQNNFSNVIKIEHCGIGINKITKDSSILGAVLTTDEIKNVELAGFKTLDEVVAENKIESAALKIDVDGFEYDILRSASVETLKKFDSIYLEYHYGVRDIQMILEKAGFLVNVTKVVDCIVSNHPTGYESMEIGYLSARKLDSYVK